MVQRKMIQGKKIGVVFGTFAPMHIGHLHLVMKAKRQNEGVVIVASGYKGDRGELEADLPLQRRFRYIRELFNDDNMVNVSKLDESNIPRYPNGWLQWLQKLELCVENSIVNSLDDVDITIYCGEKEYQEKLLELRPNWNVVLVDRKATVNISGTMIRKEPIKFFRAITHPFQKHFTKKVLIVGSASTGKTTLARDLGKLFHAPVSLEYAREYEEVYNVTDDELTENDYIRLITGQFDQTSKHIDGFENNGLVIADTNSTVTMCYINHYLKNKISESDYHTLKELYQKTVSKEKWDLVLVTKPVTEYVDDGFRDMTMSSSDIRMNFHNDLMKLLEETQFSDKVVVLESENKEFVFEQNMEQSISSIENIIGLKLGQI